MRLRWRYCAAVLVVAIVSACNDAPTNTSANSDAVWIALQGNWTGYEISNPAATVQLSITGFNYSYTIQGINYYSGVFTINPSSTPSTMDASVVSSVFPQYAGKMSLAIFQLTADTLVIAGNEPGVATRPSSYAPSPGTAMYRLVRGSHPNISYGDTVAIAANGPAASLDLSPRSTAWLRFAATKGTIYRFTMTGSLRVTVNLLVDSTTNLGSSVYIGSATRWTGQKTGDYYIRVTADSAYVDTGVVTISVQALPTQASGETGSYLCWNNFKLARMDASTGAVTTIGKSTDFFPILQYGPDGTLYGVCTDLCVIDPVSDKITVIGNFRDGGSYLQMGDGAISPSGVLYVRPLSSSSVYTVNLTTAALTLACTCSVRGCFAFDANGTLYIGSSSLSKADLAAFTVTTIGNFTRSQRKITFTAADRLMGMSYDSLYAIDISTARVSSRLLLGDGNLDCFVEERPAVRALTKRRDGPRPHRTMEELEAMRQRHLSRHPW